MNLLKFLASQESHLASNHDIFSLAAQAVNVFNVFVTYGDMFLPNTTSYDQLYYELIRTHQTFDNVFSMGKLCTLVNYRKSEAVSLFQLFDTRRPTERGAIPQLD